MTAYDPSEWSDLFVAVAGASAALAGLVFVAISINVERILAHKGLPERALKTVLLLLGVMIVSILGLIPGQSHLALGLELLVFSAVLAMVIHRTPTEPDPDRPDSVRWLWGRWAIRIASIFPLVIGSFSVLIASGGGLYWIAGGIVFTVISAVANAWVFLVEIPR